MRVVSKWAIAHASADVLPRLDPTSQAIPLKLKGSDPTKCTEWGSLPIDEQNDPRRSTSLRGLPNSLHPSPTAWPGADIKPTICVLATKNKGLCSGKTKTGWGYLSVDKKKTARPTPAASTTRGLTQCVAHKREMNTLTYRILMRVHEHPESIVPALCQHTNCIVHVLRVVYPPSWQSAPAPC